MSYCVNCGVELHPTAERCPLCGTPVLNPNSPPSTTELPPFPTQRREVPPADRRTLALLITAMLASAAVATGVLNLFFHRELPWSLYIVGACTMLWLFFVPPLWKRGMHRLVRLLVDIAAVAFYVYLISLAVGGTGTWYPGLALPIILLAGAFALFLGLVIGGGKRSILTSITLCIGAAGLFSVGLDLMICRYLTGTFAASWSLVVLTVSVALMIPLLVVRRHPVLREEARRRFHI